MGFKPTDVGVVLCGGVRPDDVPDSKGAVIRREAGDVTRRFGPCYEVPGGHVWRESTLDPNGRAITVWWWARRLGVRIKILRSGRTRNEAASFLR